MRAIKSRLPHWNKTNAAYFVTWRLTGSLPVTTVADVYTSEGAKFVAADRLLDAVATGPRWLVEPAVAVTVIQELLRGEGRDYELGSWVLMPNHIHIVIQPADDLASTIALIKGRTARSANRALDRCGPFWAKDYFDRWIRNCYEEGRMNRYIANNPVKAHLCRVAEDWPWSSCHPQYATEVACP